jgi:hypothetical protein
LVLDSFGLGGTDNPADPLQTLPAIVVLDESLAPAGSGSAGHFRILREHDEETGELTIVAAVHLPPAAMTGYKDTGSRRARADK